MRYCSLDLELTGFDPLTDEILEIGLVFFEPASSGLQITEQWSQTFRPTGEVHPKILGLTGLTMAELQQAPLLSDLHETIQQKLDGAIIVGHNIVLDARFLEAFGFKLSGQFIDTLDLVQFLLPTHHSYNLENLMHHLGLAHKEAHRALGDSLATIALLERLLHHYTSFDQDLQNRIQQIIKGRNFVWEKLFQYKFDFPPLSDAPQQGVSSSNMADTGIESASLPLIQPGTVTVVPLDQTTPEATARALQANPSQYLLVVSDRAAVLRLWQQGLARGIFSPTDRFDSEKFERFLLQPGLTDEQIMFGLKVLVWFHTNWQTETIIDLNLTFFGGQFRSAINNLPFVKGNVEGLVACDYETFALLSEKHLYKGRTPVLWNAHQLERWLSEGSQGRLTWNKVLYLLKSIYNPETDFGRRDLRNEVTNALAGADLFFSLVSLAISRNFSGQQYVSYESLAANDFVFNQIQTAALNFSAKVELITAQQEFAELSRFVSALREFFVPVADHVKWIETSEFNCAFVDRPLHIAPLLSKMLQPYSAPAVVNNLPDTELLQYILQRLGLFREGKINMAPKTATGPVPTSLNQGPASLDQVVALLQPDVLPAAVIFPGKAEVREFYDQHYSELKKFAAVFAQSYSGGSNKILRNLVIRPASILLATPPFLSRSPHSLALRTVVILGLPGVQAAHPYTQALRAYWESVFPDFLQLQALQEVYLLLQAIYTPKLKRIHWFTAEQPVVSKLKQSPYLQIED